MLSKAVMLKIELEEPFKSKWRIGYLVTNNENRKNVLLYNTQEDRTTVSYSRYLYSVYLGYEVPSHLQVDHINDDKTDDRLSNLQLLTQEQNRLKEHYNYIMNKQIVYGVYCNNCGSPFLIALRELNMKLKNNSGYAFCSRACASKHQFHCR